MSEQILNPFDPFFEKIREIVREEIKAASNGNGHALLTAEELSKALKVNKATVYQWVKSETIPYYQVGRCAVQFAGSFGEPEKEKRESPLTCYEHYDYSRFVYESQGLQEDAA